MASTLQLAAGIAITGFLLAREEVPQAVVPVQMTVTAEARHGKEIPELKPGDILVFANKERLPVTDLNQRTALELFILIDDASGVSLGSQFNDIRRFIQTQPAGTAVAIGYLRNAMVEVVQDLTVDHAKAAKALRLPIGYPGVMPSPFLALSDLIKRWPASAARHEVLLVSSGIDPIGGGIADPYLYAAIEHAQRAGVIVYAIYTPAAGHRGHSFWQMNWGQNHLAQIAEETGGECYMLGFGPPVSLAPYLSELSEHLAHQYLVTFLAKAGPKAGFRAIRFATEVPNAEIVGANRIYVAAAY